MANYKLTFKKSVAKDLRTIPKARVQGLLKKIDSLAENPRARGCTKLFGHDLYRARQGLYRILYTVRDHDRTVNIIKISHRSSVYQQI
ncbi:MAG: type II toxin-antitoxin system RelE/ParE family toxin [Cellvibrionales bacterium]|nr:type II toxin-antitoxin system RelE/ParE family toxin [Cellvibrionales bacterium]